jgi:hypothetical protein
MSEKKEILGRLQRTCGSPRAALRPDKEKNRFDIFGTWPFRANSLRLYGNWLLLFSLNLGMIDA